MTKCVKYKIGDRENLGCGEEDYDLEGVHLVELGWRIPMEMV